MEKEDQELREKAIKDNQNKKLIKAVYDCDTRNIREAKKIIEKYGYPIFSLVGKKASYAFWRIIQHADRDVKFQKKCLKLLEEAVGKKEAYKKNLEFLTDRIMIMEKGKQKYGTQFMYDKKGNLVKYPLIK